MLKGSTMAEREIFSRFYQREVEWRCRMEALAIHAPTGDGLPPEPIPWDDILPIEIQAVMTNGDIGVSRRPTGILSPPVVDGMGRKWVYNAIEPERACVVAYYIVIHADGGRHQVYPNTMALSAKDVLEISFRVEV